MSLFIALNERSDEPDPERSVGGNEGCSSKAVPSEAKRRISVNPREFNVIKKEHAARTQRFNPYANATSSLIFLL